MTTVVLTRRILLHWRQRPVSIAVTLLFPVLIVLMFGYLFGGAMAVPDGRYLDFLLPGMLATTMLFGLESMVTAVTADAARGITDRIRAMPVSGLAVLTSRCWADLLNALAGLAVMIAAGLAVGWRPANGPLAMAAALGLLLWLRLAFGWTGIYLGLLLRTPESAVAVQILVWPAGFLSSAYVSPSTMPAWLGAAAEWNPLSATATATRHLLGSPAWTDHSWPATHSVLLALLWPALLALLFAPLANRQYQALER
ncbi:ABC transporter permease [Actinoplanes sp. NPDC051411]|uniref:ABC transporter permease n=1 Tax=Actinoplanes sp. NPDC051411 TaxID=3155522 RepID=UPI003441E206